MTPEYSKALARSKTFVYQAIPMIVSALVVGMQAEALRNLPWSQLEGVLSAAAILSAFVSADFFNGYVHMLVDRATFYRGPFGPLIAVFHTHHHRNEYPIRKWPEIYVTESGSKIWLVFVLILVLFAEPHAKPEFALFMVAFCVLSSIAEISHYVVHTRERGLAHVLQRLRIFVTPGHHAKHHTMDNVNYAFLCGWTDVALNIIARALRMGYMDSDNHSRPSKGTNESELGG